MSAAPAALRILLVDDNPDDRALVRRELAREFARLEILEISDRRRFEDVLEHEGFDVLITDYQLKWSDGLSVLHAVKNRHPHCPTLMFTGSGSEEIAVEAMKNGLDDYVVKAPRHYGRLPAAVRRALERAEHGHALRAARSELQGLFDRLPVGIYRTNAAGVLLYANPALHHLLGYADTESLAGRAVAEAYVEPAERVRWQALVERDGAVPGFRARLRRRDGTEIWVRDSARSVHDDAGRLLYYEGVLEDVTDAQRAELEVHRQTTLLELLHAITVAVRDAATLDEALALVLREVGQFTGWPVGHVYRPAGAPVELESSRLWYLPEPERFAAFRRRSEATGIAPGIGPAGRAYLTGTAQWATTLDDDPRFRDRAHNAHAWPATGLAIPVSAAGGEVVAVLEFFHDEPRAPDRQLQDLLVQIGIQLGRVAERQRADEHHRSMEAQLRAALKMEAIGRLAGGVAHDFNNVLTAIVACAELLLADLPADDPRREDLDEIRKAAERGATLTRQLIAFGRRQMVVPEPTDLNDIIRHLDRMLRRIIGGDVTIHVALADDLYAVQADHGQMEQVLINLVVNARDAMPDGGHLTIETANVELDDDYAREHVAVTPGPYVLLAVSDSGVGMDADTLEHAFEPFFTTKGPGRGTGLGLATVYGIVKQTGGNVWVYSEPGHGSTFKVYLPQSGERPAPTPPVSAAAPRGGTETILLVEDADAVRRSVRRTLESHGYTVLEARGGREAVQICGSYPHPIQLLLTDVVMPEMGGSQVADALKKMRPELQVLYMSGFTDNAAVRQGVVTHAMPYIEKPFAPATLARKVRDVLERSPGQPPGAPRHES